MGIGDRDYMRETRPEPKLRKPRAQLKKAENKPSIVKRIQFWLWNLKKR